MSKEDAIEVEAISGRDPERREGVSLLSKSRAQFARDLEE